jgi:hypothetical protein
VHAELTIKHKPGDLIAGIANALPAHNPLVVENSVALAREEALWATVELAVETPGYRLLCWANTNIELQGFVEATGQADLKEACQTVWGAFRSAVPQLEPKLGRLEIADEVTGRPLMIALPGFGARLGQRETLTATVIGTVSLVLLLVGMATFGKHTKANLAAGAAPALISGGLAVLWAALDAARGRFVWRG